MNRLLKFLCVAVLIAGFSLIAASANAQWGCGHGGYHGGYGGYHGGYAPTSTYYAPRYGHSSYYAPSYNYGYRGHVYGHTPYYSGYRGYPYGNPYRPFGGYGW